LASAAIASAVALAGCDTDGNTPMMSGRAMQPLSSEMVTLLAQKNMPKESAILVRIFKEESEMEVWKQDTTGRFALLKTYPICRWSGELGPKIKEGDRQAPEGFYTITPGQMNPNSNYYLSFNLGYPNAYDRANDRTGAFLMVHGICSSAGCYAMTDEQMGEIYALGREALFGGQKAFQIQAYPFRMTAINLARHRNNPAMPFWRMIKEGSDHFEVTGQEPKVDVCEKRYVFDATTTGRFDPRGKCPAYKVPDDVVAAVAEKQERDDREFAALVSRGTPTVAVKTGSDGGMNPVFLAKLKSPDVFDSSGRIFSLASTAHVPAMGANVNPPKAPAEADTTTASVTPPRATPQDNTRVAVADAGPSQSGSMFRGLFGSNGDQAATAEKSEGPLNRVGKLFGLHGSDPAPQPQTQTAAPAPKARPAEARPAAVIAAAPAHHAPGAIRPTQPAEPRPQIADEPKSAPPAPAPTATASAAPGMMAGAVPVVSSNSFESRWGGMR
jgi:murein L,D-transpeptidase YafK